HALVRRRAELVVAVAFVVSDGVVVHDIECRAHLGRQVILAAPADELADGFAHLLRVAPIFERGDASVRYIDDLYFASRVSAEHDAVPRILERFIDCVPGSPLRLIPELRRRLAEALAERARERLRAAEAIRERDGDDRFLRAKRELP